MRITKRDSQTHIIQSDRLVDQMTELNNGGEEAENYYVTLEITIFDQSSAQLAKTYIDQITGDLPSFFRNSPTNNKGQKIAGPLMHDNYMELISEISKLKNQEVLIEKLRGMGYFFYATDHLIELGLPIQIERDLDTKYQWLVKRTKEAKDPQNDKIDSNFIVGVKIVGKKFEKVLVYYRNPQSPDLFLKRQPPIKMSWPEEPQINYKKIKVTLKFPSVMTHDDRKKWRNENEKVKRNPNYVPTKFYERWKPDIEEL